LWISQFDKPVSKHFIGFRHALESSPHLASNHFDSSHRLTARSQPKLHIFEVKAKFPRSYFALTATLLAVVRVALCLINRAESHNNRNAMQQPQNACNSGCWHCPREDHSISIRFLSVAADNAHHFFEWMVISLS
jgi:hypothetical protein